MTLGGEDESSELHHYRGAVSWLEKRFNFTFMDTKHTRKLTERLDIRVDWAFKYIFSKKRHLIKLIRDLLEIDMEVIEYLPNELPVNSEKDKRSRFDVLCKETRSGEVFVLEMQNHYESDMADRLYYYGSSLLQKQVTHGAKKYQVNAVLLLCIAGYDLHHIVPVPDGKVFFEYKMREREMGEVFDGDKLSICFLELNRFSHYLNTVGDLKSQWCWIFNNLAIFAERPRELDKSFDPLIEDAQTNKLTPMEKEDYMKSIELTEHERLVLYEGGYEYGREDGLAEGMEKGKAEGLKESARLLMESGMSKEEVARRLKMDVSELEG